MIPAVHTTRFKTWPYFATFCQQPNTNLTVTLSKLIIHANHLKIHHVIGPRLTLKYFWMTSSTGITLAPHQLSLSEPKHKANKKIAMNTHDHMYIWHIVIRVKEFQEIFIISFHLSPFISCEARVQPLIIFYEVTPTPCSSQLEIEKNKCWLSKMSLLNWEVVNASSKSPIISYTCHFKILVVELDVFFPQRCKLLLLNVLTTTSHTYHKLPTEQIVVTHSKVVGISQKHQLKVLGLAKCKMGLLFYFQFSMQYSKFKHTSSTLSTHLQKKTSK